MTVITSILMLGRKGFGVKETQAPPVPVQTIGDIPFIATANPRYVDIAFLGAHDANTGIVKRGASTEAAASKALKKFEPMIRNYVSRFVKTQSTSIYRMLECGCRFLHIKVTKEKDGWYTSHSILTGELSVHILDILRYLSEHEKDGEIISILFQPIHFADQSFADFHDYLAEIKYNEKNIFHYIHYSPVAEFPDQEGIHVSDLRYNNIVGKDGTSGLVLFERRDQHFIPSWDSRQTSYPYFFDMDTNALHTWHSRSNIRKLDKEIGKTVKEILSTDKYNDMLRMNQTQPANSFRSLGDALSSIYSLSLLHMAKRHNQKLLRRKDFGDMMRAMPVFQVDFVTSNYGDFNKKANEAIRKCNEELVNNLLK